MQNAHLLTRMPVSILLPTGAVLLNGRTLLRGGAEHTQAESQPKSERKFSRKSAKSGQNARQTCIDVILPEADLLSRTRTGTTAAGSSARQEGLFGADLGAQQCFDVVACSKTVTKN